MPQTKTRRPSAADTYQLVEVPDMTGGLDLRSTPSQLEPTRARKLMNWSLSEPGALVVRPGWQQFSATELSTLRMQGARRIYLSSRTFTLAASSGHIFQVTDTGGWDSSGSTQAVYSTEIDRAGLFRLRPGLCGYLRRLDERGAEIHQRIKLDQVGRGRTQYKLNANLDWLGRAVGPGV